MISMVLWEYLFSLFDSLLLMKFSELFLQNRKNSLVTKIIGTTLLSILIFVSSYAPVYSYASTFVLLFLSIIYCVTVFRGGFVYKIAIGILFQILYSLYSVGLVSLVSMFLGDFASYIFEYDSIIRISFIVITRAIFFLIIWFASYKVSHRTMELTLPKKSLLYLCMVMLVILIINNLLVNNTDSSKANEINILILGIVVFSFIFAVTLKKLFDEKAERENLQIQKRSLEMQKEDYDNRVKMNKDIRKMKHDIKNNLISIESLVRDKKYDEAEKYLNKLSNLPALKKVIDSGNPVIDGLLNSNIQSYKDINFYVNIDIKKCAIDFDILSTILGNMMDNAIEATISNLDNKPDIFIRISENEKRIILEVENGYIKEPVLKKGKIVTSKKDQENHGFGIHNIEQAAKNYNGQVNYDINKKDKHFKISVLLMKM